MKRLVIAIAFVAFGMLLFPAKTFAAPSNPKDCPCYDDIFVGGGSVVGGATCRALLSFSQSDSAMGQFAKILNHNEGESRLCSSSALRTVLTEMKVAIGTISAGKCTSVGSICKFDDLTAVEIMACDAALIIAQRALKKLPDCR